MKNGVRLLPALALASFFQAQPLAAQTVTNVRASQLPDKTVEVLYDISGAASGGATVTVAFSSDGGSTYSIVPPSGALSGSVGTGVGNGTNRRIVWNAAATLPAQTYGTNYRAAVTVTNPSSGGQEVTYTLPGGVPLVMVRIPAGTFQMGSPPTERGRDAGEILHTVTLTSDYYIGKYEVTQSQWLAVMGGNPSYYSSCGGDCPVDSVTWFDVRGANGFTARLNQLLGTTTFRLPTSAEWERATRGGTQTRFSFGDALDGDDVCGTNAAANPYVWWCGNDGNRPHPVGLKSPNPYGLHDVHGNVVEWVEDWQQYYSSEPQTDPTGPATGQYKESRGGAWGFDLRYARSAKAGNVLKPAYGNGILGFRLCRSVNPVTTATGYSSLFAIDLRVAQCALSCSATVSATSTAGTAVAFQSSVTPSNCSGSVLVVWEFGDGGTSGLQNPEHVYPGAGTYSWKVTISIGNAACIKTGTIAISAPPQCSIDCSASVPERATAGVATFFSAAATAKLCSGPTQYAWDFGDGKKSSLQKPSHVYSSPGLYSWSLTVTAGSASCTRTGSVEVVGPPSLPPVLFVHGFCSSGPDAWPRMIANLRSLNPQRYQGTTVDLYFDGNWVRDRNDPYVYYPDRGTPLKAIKKSSVYTISFFSPSALDGFDPFGVNDIPIEREAFQLSKVIEAIVAVNQAPSLDLVGHSQGGLVSRAYVEGLASDGYRQLLYGGNVRQIVTIDTPHAGSHLWDSFAFGYVMCQAEDSVQRQQLHEGSDFLATLNAHDVPTPIATIVSSPWRVPIIWNVLCSLRPGDCTTSNDCVVSVDSQNLGRQTRYSCQPNVRPLPNPVDADVLSRCVSLHSAVLDLPQTAVLADIRLSLSAFAPSQCQTYRAGSASSVSLPGASTGGTWEAVLSFVPGEDSPQVGLSSYSCSVDVVALTANGAEVDRKRVSATGFQRVTFHDLPAGWKLSVEPECDVDVDVSANERAPIGNDEVAPTLFVPIVLDVATGTAHFTTELTLSNRGTTWARASLRYAAALNPQGGGGTAVVELPAGAQVTIPDVMSELRRQGLAIPSHTESLSEGGTLLVSISGASSADVVSVLARTTTATSGPQPPGAAGLAYVGLDPSAGSDSSSTVFGLRQTASDRSNLAVYNPTPDPVVLRVTAQSGDGYAGAVRTVIRDDFALPGHGWYQFSQVFQGTGITQGWVIVEKVGGSGQFGAYGVINDNGTSDGSYVLPTSGTFPGNRVTVPVLVESSAFRSELVLANKSDANIAMTLDYVESAAAGLGTGGTRTVWLKPREQKIVPDAIEFLRSSGVGIGPRGAATYAGALRVTVNGAPLSEVFAGARTASQSPAAGQFGLFTPGVYEGQEASDEAYLYGLRADSQNRSNVAVLNAAPAGSGSVTLELRSYDGDLDGSERGAAEYVTLAPGQWKQYTNFLKERGIRNGWVKVTRTAGTAPWIAYGVVNDGANPGERTGDGAYVPMTVKGGGAPPTGGDEITVTLPGGVPLVLVRIPAGTFQMGSPESERSSKSWERPVHPVTLTSDYYVGKYEVTQAQWQAVMGSNPSSFSSCGGNCPVELVSWEDICGANGFIAKLNQLLGTTAFRLPTEAEWERAARGGTQTRFSFGDALDGDDACGANAEANPYVWWCGNGGGKTNPVGTKGANPYGLFDMHGNVWEWVEDWYGSYPTTAQTNPPGPASGSHRVYRGGGWGYGLLLGTRSANRDAAPPGGRDRDIGFRLAKSL